ncbi:NPCBM/NEW2 domain-containing protein [Paenibacillus polymyxa]|uniref:NPCBM/NEW2 domain-containing protein n=1 Tax=Paenibacillus polymyxa TaxID=1406 RepID=UPI000FB6270D|nr:NPCBM/NEW2 domain-containing protein [Paenibacillus polymyxa]MDY8095852.1 NPCBM/NEW2 domain-containing protein [Paenibacillus polymyxa]
MKDKVKGLVLGLTIGTMITGVSAYAASTAKIEVIYDNLKYMVDGNQKVPSSGQGFIYQGTTYVPLRFAGEAAGKEVTWDGKNKTIWFGKKDSAFKYLSDIPYARMDGRSVNDLDLNQNYDREKITIAGKQYQKGISTYISPYALTQKLSLDYNLNGKFKKFTGELGVDDKTKNAPENVTITFIGDDRELSRFSVKGGDNPLPVTVDLTGVLKFRIVFEIDPKSSDFVYGAIGDAKIFD